MKFYPIPQTTIKCDRENHKHLKYAWNVIIVQSCIQNPPCQISESLLLFAWLELFQLFSFLCRLWIFQVIDLIWANSGQLSSETTHKETEKCIYLSFHLSLVFQSNNYCCFQHVVPWLIPVLSTTCWNKTSEFHRNIFYWTLKTYHN